MGFFTKSKLTGHRRVHTKEAEQEGLIGQTCLSSVPVEVLVERDLVRESLNRNDFYFDSTIVQCRKQNE